jgi:hypothetical protein
MTTLARELRQDLERTVKQARRVAELGARKSLEQLGVHSHEPYSAMSPEQRALRNRLRAHGRQVGDRRDRQKGTQTIDRLIQECAYEHWHRMLFARFLAETDLLIEPHSGVPITLEECQELARDEDADWLEVASNYAERMLPQIFRSDDPVLAVTLPPETRSGLEDLLKSLPKDIFAADDSLGWVYQFWQAEKKEEINRSETKIGADELPAVTQLFTEDYIVHFILHNTLGAWWAGRILASHPELAASATSEEELRAACEVGGVNWSYLRFIRETGENGNGSWHPAAGTFKGWPKAAKSLTLLDPCMGSGHFLIFALPILVAFRMAEEGLCETDAVEAVLRNNLYGLEIDPRCTQIAAFNLALAAWRRVGYRTLPPLNLACSGLAIGIAKTEWLRIAEKAVAAVDPATKREPMEAERKLQTYRLEDRAKNGLESLYELFAKAPWLGSLIDPRRAGADIFREGFDELEPLITSILAAADPDDAREIAVAARGMAKAAEMLACTFTLVITNVPYLGRGKQDQTLRDYCDKYHVAGKADLATCFVERCIDFSALEGTAALVTPQNWLFLGTYKELRKSLLTCQEWNLIARLGEGGFESNQAAGAFTAMVTLTRANPDEISNISGIDTSFEENPESKSYALRCKDITIIRQNDQVANPDSLISFDAIDPSKLLGRYADCFQGISPGDSERLVLGFWEVSTFTNRWRFFQTPPSMTKLYDGKSSVIDWMTLEAGFEAAAIRGGEAWNSSGIAIGQMRQMPATIYNGELFSNSTPVIIPKDATNLAAIWAYCSSPEFNKEMRKLNPKVSVDNGYVNKVQFDLGFWKKEALKSYPFGLPEPKSNDPTQWIFDGQPNDATAPLLVAVARLLGYRWPRQNGSSFHGCHALASDRLEGHVDDDGIVCLSALKGEPRAEQRLNALLADAFGTNWSATKLAGELVNAGSAGKLLDDWLRDEFFTQHCELFQQRPFIWHIWDGRRDGFQALVNYHRLAAPRGEGRQTLEKLIYSYLGDWIDRQRIDQTTGVEGADARLAHAEHLRAELIKILEGEPPYDIFVRWKPLHQQAIGWDPDLNDGVRINIRPFLAARPLVTRAKNVCILRSTPKIKWSKDRGKEPFRDKKNYPWYWEWDEAKQNFDGGDKFDGNRWNDLHYSISAKQAARSRQETQCEGKT